MVENSAQLTPSTDQFSSYGLQSKSDRPYSSYNWARENYTRWGRLLDIGRVTFLFLLSLWVDQHAWSYRAAQLPMEEQKAKRNRVRAIWLRDNLLELGPTFIKVGQFFSTRADLFPAEYIEELSKLQDRVPAFEYEQVEAIIQKELGQPVHEIYAYFEPVPLASASLGQVHRAQLTSGEEVAVKVQRPGLKRLFGIDLAILKSIAEYVQHRTRWGKGGRDWVGIYNECHRTLWEEVDYLNEGRNAAMFRRNFRDVKGVIVPRIHWRYTSPRLLTMEYLPGIKVTDFDALAAAGIERPAIARSGAESYLLQVLHHGFFHADPHPGNLAVNTDGDLIFYDFGMMGEIPSQTKEKLMLTFSGILNQNADLVVESMVGLGALAPDSDLGPVRRSVQYMLETYFNQSFDAHDTISVAAINDDLYELSYNQPFRFPATFTFVLRALSTLEALGKSLDPEFNFMEIVQPFAEEIMANDTPNTSNALLDQLRRQATEFTNTSLQLPQHMETTLNKLQQGDLKMRVSIVETNRELRTLNTIGLAVVYALVFSTAVLSGTQLLTAGWLWAGGGVLGFALIVALSLGYLLIFKLDRSQP